MEEPLACASQNGGGARGGRTPTAGTTQSTSDGSESGQWHASSCLLNRVGRQEVDEFQSFWEPELKSRGYDALYKQRTQVSGNKKDGTLSGRHPRIQNIPVRALRLQPSSVVGGLRGVNRQRHFLQV